LLATSKLRPCSTAAEERGANAEGVERIAERTTYVEEGLGEIRGDLVEGLEAVRGELDTATEDLRDAVSQETDARTEALSALEQRAAEADVKTKAAAEEAAAGVRRAFTAEVGAREKAEGELHDRLDDEIEARLADVESFQEVVLEVRPESITLLIEVRHVETPRHAVKHVLERRLMS